LFLLSEGKIIWLAWFVGALLKKTDESARIEFVKVTPSRKDFRQINPSFRQARAQKSPARFLWPGLIAFNEP